ncbi:glycosyltransferase [Brumimicrobium glaciale]|nr:glycosyltransferase [Brumimicrobium glaciale]
MKKRLVLISSGFPYGKSETFLESEIKYLANVFEEINILCPEPKDTHLRSLPSNCSVAFYSKEISNLDKLKALLGLFSSTVRKELNIIKNTYQLRLSKGILSTLLISIYQAKKIAETCRNKYLKEQQKDSETVFYSYWCDDTALALALLKQEYPEIKCVSRTHGWDVYFGVHELNYLPFRHFIADNLNSIFTISNKGKEEIRETWKVKDLSTIQVSRLGVERQEIQTNQNSSVFTLVSCSNVIPLKRVNLIAEAVLSSQEPVHWIHFGDGVELNKIQKYCEENKQVHHDISFRGRLANEEVLDFYKTNWIDAFINVSSSEGVPVSIMETMSFGIPCIATDVGGNSEIVNDENGALLDSNPSFKAIQTAFKQVLNDSKKREAAYKTWEEKYNAEKNYKTFVENLMEN